MKLVENVLAIGFKECPWFSEKFDTEILELSVKNSKYRVNSCATIEFEGLAVCFLNRKSLTRIYH